MTATAVVTRNTDYPGVEKKTLGTVAFAKVPENYDEPVTERTGAYDDEAWDDIKTFGDFLTKVIGTTGVRVWNWKEDQ